MSQDFPFFPIGEDGSDSLRGTEGTAFYLRIKNFNLKKRIAATFLLSLLGSGGKYSVL